MKNTWKLYRSKRLSNCVIYDLCCHVILPEENILHLICRNGFPGAQPVSMDCSNIQFLAKVPYKVSWKADGVRYVCLIIHLLNR